MGNIRTLYRRFAPFLFVRASAQRVFWVVESLLSWEFCKNLHLRWTLGTVQYLFDFPRLSLTRCQSFVFVVRFSLLSALELIYHPFSKRFWRVCVCVCVKVLATGAGAERRGRETLGLLALTRLALQLHFAILDLCHIDASASKKEKQWQKISQKKEESTLQGRFRTSLYL